MFEDKHGFVLAGMENMKYKETEIELEEGDKIYLYTDGVPEGTNSNNEMYGTERMLTALNHNSKSSTQTILHDVKKDLDEFVGDAPQFDDVTMMCLEINKKRS